MYKSSVFMNALKESIVGRLLDLLERFTGQKYYSQSEVDLLLSRNIQPNMVGDVHVKGITTTRKTIPKPIPKIIPKTTIKRVKNVKVVKK